MTQDQVSDSNRTFGQVLGSILKFLLRFIVVLLIGALIGAGLYYGVPWLYREFIQPVRDNTIHIQALERRFDRESTDLREKQQALDERLAALETDVATLAEDVPVNERNISDLHSRVERLEATMVTSETMTATQARLEALEDQIADLEEDLSAQEDDLADAIADQEEKFDLVETTLDTQMTNLQKLETVTLGQTAALEGRLVLLQTAQDLLRVRLLLLDDNVGAARETLELADRHLERAILVLPAEEATLIDIRGRVTALDELIGQRSFRVTTELEALWADVMDLAMPSTPISTSPLAVTGTLTSTATMTPTTVSPLATPATP
jgi:predicted  nucleic acid-binding Zn-ribbon protein